MVTHYEYRCWRDHPFECRAVVRMKDKLPENHSPCQVCGSYKTTFQKIEVKEDGHTRPSSR